jgi:POT family proton-dependent oligopeptide transporter
MSAGISAKQPKGLYLLFFTELWERFGFYTLQAIIVLYMTHALLYDDAQAYLLYGTFSSMLYLTPAFGGYLADRFIGFQRSILIGSVLLIIGYLFTALSQTQMFFLGLSAIIVGNGFFKPNVSSLVGELYTADDPRRDGGFTIFYMGINIGSLIPPLITGALVAKFGWHMGFIFAAGGITIALVNFLGGRKRLGSIGGIPEKSPLKQTPACAGMFYFLLTLGIVIVTALFYLIFYVPKEAVFILIGISFWIILAIVYFLLRERPEEQRKMFACLILILISIGFWAFYNQTFTSLMLFADRNMIPKMLGFKIDPEFIQFFNPLFIVILSPILSWLWIYLDKRHLNPSTPMKFSLGILFMAFGFLFLGGAVAVFSKGGFTSPWWLGGSYLLQTVGELLLSPIGLAMITRLSPKHLVGMMMGVWFLTQSAGFAIGGLFSTLADVPKGLGPEESMVIYAKAFVIYGLISMGLAVLSLLLVPVLKKLIYSSVKN